MADRRYLNGRQVDADGRDLLTGKDPWALPHGCSWSAGEVFQRSRQTYYRCHHVGTMERDVTRPMKFGQVTHLAVLEPDRFADVVAVGPEINRSTRIGKAAVFDGELVPVTAKPQSKAWKDAVKENPDAYVVTLDEHGEAMEIRDRLQELAGKMLVTADEMRKATSIRDAVWAHPVARKLLTKAGLRLEAETHWLDPSGLEIFAHTDGIYPGGAWDLKTSNDLRMQPFIRSCERYGYHRQAGIYLVDAHQEFFGGPGEVFHHIVTSSAEPWDVEVYEMDPDWVNDGIREARDTFARVAHCVAQDDWRTPSQRSGMAVVIERPIGAAATRAAFELPEEWSFQ